MIRFLQVLFLTVAFNMVIPMLFACQWCDAERTGRPVPIVQQLVHDRRDRESYSVLLPGREKRSIQQTERQSVAAPSDSSVFARDYLYRFYPRVAVISETFLPTFCIPALERALHDYCSLIHDNIIFYFTSDTATFGKLRQVHIEIIAEQCDTLRKNIAKSSFAAAINRSPYFHDLCALCVDLRVRLMYIALQNEQLTLASQRFDTFRKANQTLRTTPHAKRYGPVEEVLAQLMMLLRQRLRGRVA